MHLSHSIALTLLAAFVPSAASADIIYSGMLNRSVPQFFLNEVGNITTEAWDLDGDGRAEFRFTQGAGLYLARGQDVRVLANPTVPDRGDVAVLEFGQRIGPDSPAFLDEVQWSRASLLRFEDYGFFNQPVVPAEPRIFMPSGPWVRERAYFGVEFLIEVQTHYGWVQMDFDRDVPLRFGDGATLIDFAYESTPGKAITAGTIPEPATYGLVGVCIAFGALMRQSVRRHVR
ncbi:MAG: hypothetical protein ACFB20_03495 [Opitutales bacterium]